MNSCEEYIAKINRNLPELASVKDLVSVGIFRNAQTAYAARRQDRGPPFFWFPCRGICYPKSGVIEWLRDCIGKKHAP